MDLGGSSLRKKLGDAGVFFLGDLGEGGVAVSECFGEDCFRRLESTESFLIGAGFSGKLAVFSRAPRGDFGGGLDTLGGDRNPGSECCFGSFL